MIVKPNVIVRTIRSSVGAGFKPQPIDFIKKSRIGPCGVIAPIASPKTVPNKAPITKIITYTQIPYFLLLPFEHPLLYFAICIYYYDPTTVHEFCLNKIFCNALKLSLDTSAITVSPALSTVLPRELQHPPAPVV